MFRIVRSMSDQLVLLLKASPRFARRTVPVTPIPQKKLKVRAKPLRAPSARSPQLPWRSYPFDRYFLFIPISASALIEIVAALQLASVTISLHPFRHRASSVLRTRKQVPREAIYDSRYFLNLACPDFPSAVLMVNVIVVPAAIELFESPPNEFSP